MEFFKAAEIFLAGGMGYGIIELLFRGRTHITMGILGGACFLFISITARYSRGTASGILLSLINGIFITAAEAAMGYFLNIRLGLNVWNYESLPLNFYGQICLRFSAAWSALSFFAMKAAILNDKLLLCEKFPQST